MIHILGGFLLIAMICGSKAEASYVCLDDSSDLQPCNFERMQRTPAEGNLEKKTRIANGAVMESLYQAPEGTVVVYKLEGCIPGRLPFTLPICKREDTMGRAVEVRRLFPFVIAGDPPTAPFFFPEVEAAQLYQASGDLPGKIYNPIVSKQDLKLDRQSFSKLSHRKKKLILDATKRNRKHEKVLDSEMIGSGISSMRSPLFKSKHFRRRDDVDNAEGLRKYSRSGDGSEASLPEYEFPYARAVHYDLETIRRLLHLPRDVQDYTKHGSEFPYSLAIPFDPEKHRNLLHESERHRHAEEVPKFFPYDKAVPFDPMKVEHMLMWVKTADMPASKKWKREVVNAGTEFPYNRAVPYNDWKVAEFRRRLEARLAGRAKE